MDLGNRKMELTGIHYMPGLDQSEDLTTTDKEVMKKLQERAQLEMADNLCKQNEGIKSAANKEIVACNSNVIIKLYDRNPYRSIKTSASGIIYGLDGHEMYFSHESGEMEESHQEIICAEVIAIGPECKNVKVGEDVYCRNIPAPIPFDNRGYYAITEQNIICRIVNKN
jgi:hypothetical protein